MDLRLFIKITIFEPGRTACRIIGSAVECQTSYLIQPYYIFWVVATTSPSCWFWLQVAADFFILIFCTTVKLYRLFTVLSDEGSERLTDRQLDRLLIFPPYLLFMMMSEQAEDDDDDDVLLLLKKQNNKQQLTMPDASRCIAAHGH